MLWQDTTKVPVAVLECVDKGREKTRMKTGRRILP